MIQKEPQFGEPAYHRRFLISYVCEAALDPNEAAKHAKIGDEPAHPTILLDMIDEVEFLYKSGWKEYFDQNEKKAIERFVRFVNQMTPISDDAWSPLSLSGPLWDDIRYEARKLITALGGLPQHLPGKWAK